MSTTKAMSAFQDAVSLEMEWNWIALDSVIGFVHMVSRELIEEWLKMNP